MISKIRIIKDKIEMPDIKGVPKDMDGKPILDEAFLLKELIKKVQELEDKLSNLQEQINDIRQSTTKESTN